MIADALDEAGDRCRFLLAIHVFEIHPALSITAVSFGIAYR
jgi:hypothetical protein